MRNAVTLSEVEVWAFRLEDSPSGHSLQVLGGFVPQPPVGFPLLSLTRNANITQLTTQDG